MSDSTDETAREPTTASTDAAGHSLMPAWAQRRYGGPETAELTRLPVPAPGRGEVQVRVRATALNSGDVKIMRGEPTAVRTAFGLARPTQPVRGMDVAATIVAVGPGVEGWSAGDEVIVELPGGGGLAAFALAPTERLAARPEGLDPQLAATLPIAGGTAWRALEKGEVAAGARVLVAGASGGVGTFAVQLAALRGAEVHALCGARSADLVRGLGASRVLDYRVVAPGSGELAAGAYDAVIDIAGAWPLRDLRRLVRPGGSVVLVSGEGGRVLGPIPRLISAGILSIGARRALRPLAVSPQADVVAELAALAASGALRPVIERVFPFGGASAALAHVDSGRTLGKVVVEGPR